jgi:tRNA-specific 2-thiouridylase
VNCVVAAHEGSRLELALAEDFYGAAPGQAACLLRGDVIVGWGTITA